MHDIRFIRDNPDAFDAALKKRGLPAQAAELIALDDARRKAIATAEQAQARRNAASKEIGAAMGKKDMAAAEALKAEVAGLKEKIAEAEAEQGKADAALKAALDIIPNMPLPEVPEGADETGNVELRTWGTPPTFDFAAKQHFELGEALGMMDFEAASRMSGARFVVLKGKLARLERALGQFMLNLHTEEHGYKEIQAPLLVREKALFGTAQLPKFAVDLYPVYTELRRLETERYSRQDLYILADGQYRWLDGFYKKFDAAMRDAIKNNIDASWTTNAFQDLSNQFKNYNIQFSIYSDLLKTIDDKISESKKTSAGDLFLIPTSEVSMTNLVMGQIVDEVELPYRFTGLTPCFRSEAGSAGRDTRGMLRQHQFNKVEMVSITTPEQSLAEHARMTRCAETVLEKLGIPYRTVVLCTGDMGFSAQKTHDIEAWLPGQGTYREISSCSVCGDFQARRMNARCKTKDAKGTRFVHTLNGSGIAVGRALIAVMENYQNADGSITVPEVLRPYMGGIEKIEKN